ncbi:MAG: DJ-1/PfpI family protein [Oscillospiraceae bacterium]|nr:DJ-1/PfpI family protein [Oscillospiraceae bacterium]
MVYVFLAPGFEEIEALAPVDILRRAGVAVQTVGIGGKTVTGSHGITVQADIAEDEAVSGGIEMIVLPGGMPGTVNLEASGTVQRFLTAAVGNQLPVAAICAAPSILAHRGLLDGCRAACAPSVRGEMAAAVLTGEPVAEDGLYITAAGAGVSIEFGLRLVARLVSQQRADELRTAMQCRPVS